MFKPIKSGIVPAIKLIAAALAFESFNLNLLLKRRRRHITKWNMADARPIVKANRPTSLLSALIVLDRLRVVSMVINSLKMADLKNVCEKGPIAFEIHSSHALSQQIARSYSLL